MKSLVIYLVLFLQVCVIEQSLAEILESLVLTQEEKDSFVNMHNKYRRQRSSSDMRLMSWDEDIARVAQDHTRKCLFQHSDSSQRSTQAFPILGENLYTKSTTRSQRNRTKILDSVGDWYNEIEDYDYDSGSCSAVCGHYTQVVWADSYKIGCGATICQPTHSGLNHRFIVSCNYGPPGNFVGESPYKIGKPCSQCRNNSDACSNGLCSNPDREASHSSAPHMSLAWGAGLMGPTQASHVNSTWFLCRKLAHVLCMIIVYRFCVNLL